MIRNRILGCIFLVVLTGCASFLKRSPEKADLHIQLGISQFNKGNLAGALSEFLQAEEYDDSNPVIQNNLGLVYFAREKYDFAITRFEKAIQLKNDYSEAKNNLVRVLIEKKDFKRSEQLLKQVDQDLTYQLMTKTQMNWGLLYFKKENYAQALPYFTKVIATFKEDCVALVYTGRTLLELQKTQLANDQLEKAIPYCRANQNDSAHYFSAISLYRLGQKQKALNRFKELIDVFDAGSYKPQAKQMIDIIEKGTL